MMKSIKLMGTNFCRLSACYRISWNHLRVYEERYRSNFMINCIFYECTISTVAFPVYIRGFLITTERRHMYKNPQK